MTPDQFRTWRKRLGYTQQKAADAIDVSVRQLAKYEHGHAEIPRTVALACAAVTLQIHDYAGGALRAGIIEGDD